MVNEYGFLEDEDYKVQDDQESQSEYLTPGVGGTLSEVYLVITRILLLLMRKDWEDSVRLKMSKPLFPDRLVSKLLRIILR